MSKNGIGLLALLLSVAGIQIAEADLLQLAFHITEVISYALLIWNQVTRSDVYNFLFKK